MRFSKLPAVCKSYAGENEFPGKLAPKCIRIRLIIDRRNNHRGNFEYSFTSPWRCGVCCMNVSRKDEAFQVHGSYQAYPMYGILPW